MIARSICVQTIHPKGQTSLCLGAQSKTLDSQVHVSPCASPTPTKDQLWTQTTGPPDAPTNGNVAYAGACVRSSINGPGSKDATCLVVLNASHWELWAAAGTVASGSIAPASSKWASLKLKVQAGDATVVVNGAASQTVSVGATGQGMVAVVSGWNVAYFDNFELDATASAPESEPLM